MAQMKSHGCWEECCSPFTTARVNTPDRMQGERGVGRAWENAMKKACQHYLFYWFNSKDLPFKLYVALAGSIGNTATNKKRYPQKLEHFHIFIFLFPPLAYSFFCVQFCEGFAHFIIFMSNYYDSTTYDSSVPPRGINGTGEGNSRPTEDSVNHEVSFKVWKVMPVRKLLKINSPKWLTPGCKKKKKYHETVTLLSLWFTLFHVFYTTWCSFDK